MKKKTSDMWTEDAVLYRDKKSKLFYHVQKQIHQRCIIEVEMQFKLIPESLIFICYHLIGALFLLQSLFPLILILFYFFLCSVSGFIVLNGLYGIAHTNLNFYFYFCGSIQPCFTWFLFPFFYIFYFRSSIENDKSEKRWTQEKKNLSPRNWCFAIDHQALHSFSLAAITEKFWTCLKPLRNQFYFSLVVLFFSYGSI